LADKTDLPILTFATAAEFEEWLASQPEGAPGAWLKFAKKNRPTQTIAKSDAVDIALCHGWIDGQLARFDDGCFLTRFTPRKAASLWSDNNRKRALALIEAGRMQPRGLSEVEKARADGRWEKAYAPQSKAEIPEDLGAALAVDPEARRFFETLRSVNRYAIVYRLHQTTKPEARARKLAEFIAMLKRGVTIHPQGKG
jgi:uncharacterized protein YdeI (YjbR/CyaY-like superfamily)